MNVDSDRLSSLSDDLITKILSYIDTKDSISTSILSSRWMNIWKSIPHLNLSYHNYSCYETFPKFYKYVTCVMSFRNNEVELASIKLSWFGEVRQEYITKIMKYVFSHNVQKFTIESTIYRSKDQNEIHLSSFISESLKDLTLIGSGRNTKITSSWDLPALTTLHLDNVIFSDYGKPDECVDLFSKCPNLKNLTLTKCCLYGWNDFTIFHSQLSNLTLEDGQLSYVSVVAPHLKNLTVVDCEGHLIISTPELFSLTYENRDEFKFSSDGLSLLEKANFYISNPDKEDASKIIDMLQQMCNVKYLTLGLEIVEVLASCVQLVSHLPSPFANLMSFKIYPKNIYFNDSSHRSKCSRMEDGGNKINMPSEVKTYLLDGSPCATVTIFSREEVQELKDAKSAEKKMAELQKLLNESKEPINCHNENMNIDQGDTLNTEKQHVKEEISPIYECWYDLFGQIKDGGSKINVMFYLLREIEDLLKKVPASKKDMIQARLSSLRAEAYSVIKLITGSKIALGSVFMKLL